MTTRSVLISGASISGPALAWWLNAAGWRTTVVERFGELRDTGQNIDVRGAAREVVRRMGLEDAALAATTGERGTVFVGRDGRALAEFPAGETDTSGATAEMEILRGELSRLLYEHTCGETEYVFGDRITALDDHGDGVAATFEHGPERTFDVVVIAEGLTSRTRALVFPQAEITSLGLYTAYLTIPRSTSDTDWWRWYNAPRGRSITLRPDNLGTTRATLSFMSDVGGLEDLEPDDQARVLRRTFADAGWETPRILDALDGTPFYFDLTGQMRLPAWSNGRRVMVGDAAYCASPLSGMGTSLALVGAYVLAGELATHDDHRAAFARYEAVMRPYVDGAQQLPPGTPRIAHPRTRAGVALLRAGIRVVGSAPVKRLAGLGGSLFSPPADKLELPQYPATVR
ncbi:FAD-dependent monooxygenase [Pseudonocardia ailaonensis]|uniref:FAD-dependent monooxygenase n=1 Tax=Pseudonocardia ailaonensis TaxID=367279 RepID=A0ABN2N5T7_9PSEU